MYLCNFQMTRAVNSAGGNVFPDGENRKKDDEPTRNQMMITQMLSKKGSQTESEQS